jgi:signal transduction histidine kinase
VRDRSASRQSLRLALGFLVALATLAVFAVVALRQTAALQSLQEEVIDRNRLDSLQLLRIQSTLNELALAARDMQEGGDGYPIPAFRPQVDRLLLDLADALRREGELAPLGRPAGQGQMLRASQQQLRESFVVAFRLAEEGRSKEASRQLAGPVYQQRTAMAALVARLLVQNYEAEERTAEQSAAIHADAERTLLLFVGGMALLVLCVGGFTIWHNRRVLNELEQISAERGKLAREMIGMQENILRTVSRELHDDFGQILTAVNATLARIRRRSGIALDASLAEQIDEVHEATRLALERARDLSQTLHPAVLESHGLVGALERFLPGFERQSGVRIALDGVEQFERVPAAAAIHVYRVIQEALTNIARHAETRVAWIRANVEGTVLSLEIEDHGLGWNQTLERKAPGLAAASGLGIVAMRERAQILNGALTLEQPAEGGTRVRLQVPLREEEAR